MIQAFIILSIVFAIIPCLVWFVRNYKRNNNPNYSWRYDQAIKQSLVICVPISIIFIIVILSLVGTGTAAM